MAVLADEQERIARDDLVAHFQHQRREGVEALPHVDGRSIREHAHAPAQAKHDRLRKSWAISSTERPSTSKLQGPRTMRCTTCASGSFVLTTRTRLNLGPRFSLGEHEA